MEAEAPEWSSIIKHTGEPQNKVGPKQEYASSLHGRGVHGTATGQGMGVTSRFPILET